MIRYTLNIRKALALTEKYLSDNNRKLGLAREVLIRREIKKRQYKFFGLKYIPTENIITEIEKNIDDTNWIKNVYMKSKDTDFDVKVYATHHPDFNGSIATIKHMHDCLKKYIQLYEKSDAKHMSNEIQIDGYEFGLLKDYID